MKFASSLRNLIFGAPKKVPTSPIPWSICASLLKETKASEVKRRTLRFSFKPTSDYQPHFYDIYTEWNTDHQREVPTLVCLTYLRGLGPSDFSGFEVEGLVKIGTAEITGNVLEFDFDSKVKAEILRTLIKSTPDFTRLVLPPLMDSGMDYSLHTGDVREIVRLSDKITEVKSLRFGGVFRVQVTMLRYGFELSLVAGPGRNLS